MRNLAKPTEFGNNEIQFRKRNSGELEKSADLFSAEPTWHVEYQQADDANAPPLVPNLPAPENTALDRPDWTISDQKEREKFRLIRHFVCKCRQLWPDAKIIIRAHDSICVDLSGAQS